MLNLDSKAGGNLDAVKVVVKTRISLLDNGLMTISGSNYNIIGVNIRPQMRC